MLCMPPPGLLAKVTWQLRCVCKQQAPGQRRAAGSMHASCRAPHTSDSSALRLWAASTAAFSSDRVVASQRSPASLQAGRQEREGGGRGSKRQERSEVNEQLSPAAAAWLPQNWTQPSAV